MQGVPLSSTPCSCQVPLGVSTKSLRLQRHLVAIDDRVGAAAFHDEAQSGGRMRVGGRNLAGVHDLQAGIEPADRGRGIAATGIVQIDHATARLLRSDQSKPSGARDRADPDIATAPGPSGIAAPRARSCSPRSTARRLRSARDPCNMPAVPECLPHWRVQQHPPAWDPPIGKADLHCTIACRVGKIVCGSGQRCAP